MTNELKERLLASLQHVADHGFTENLFSYLRNNRLVKQIRPNQAGPWVLTDRGKKFLSEGVLER